MPELERFTIVGLDGIRRTYNDSGKRLFGVQTDVVAVIEMKPEPPMVDNVIKLNAQYDQRRARGL